MKAPSSRSALAIKCSLRFMAAFPIAVKPAGIFPGSACYRFHHSQVSRESSLKREERPHPSLELAGQSTAQTAFATHCWKFRAAAFWLVMLFSPARVVPPLHLVHRQAGSHFYGSVIRPDDLLPSKSYPPIAPIAIGGLTEVETNSSTPLFAQRSEARPNFF
jgi:hypothetical protein